MLRLAKVKDEREVISKVNETRWEREKRKKGWKMIWRGKEVLKDNPHVLRNMQEKHERSNWSNPM